ncbi:phage terminase large subunit family protein (plasmid) [Bacillus halotolerans]|uniref:Phage terminase large subunit family protein n=1 Tax=Bacillus halotolerans TaxID=260554 RepID=A0ABY7I6K1_9BACI|nr:phage terminase large subunit family protein [Bacillus halotolerans]WAT23545.1 phage terminase large subunit family protein [Bacillus halotolerans]
MSIDLDEISNEELDQIELEIRSDPVKWAYWKLKDPKGRPWKARWYQKDMMHGILHGDEESGPHRRIAARMGRRVGKTETMVVFCLWYAFHHKNSRLLITTPYEHQVRLIFMRLNELIDDCPELTYSIKSRTKNPFITQFNNGSSIMGFTVGATSGNAGASVRGQRADWIFMDEIDYMNRDGIDAVTAIAMEDPRRIGIWCSSTPTGKRDYFYEICTNPDTGYKAYHFPSSVNPDFDEKMEGELRATMTKQGYIHEVEADFGEETVGVFSKTAVERAKSQYMYSYRELNAWEHEQFKKQGYSVDDIVYFTGYTRHNMPPAATRIVGVDWDKYGESTQIVVTEFDEMLKKFRVAMRYEIARGDFTYDNAVNKLIEINEIWNPKFFYIDAGHGEYQIEMLRKHGLLDPSSEMDKKVKRIHFKQNIEIRDPVTREIDKKDAKNFMINQTSILLERDQIVVSPFDDMIWKQMMDYQVVRISATGKPQYTSENEHALDSFMLTIMGFTLEFPNITKILEEIRVGRKVKVSKSNNQEALQEKVFGGYRDVYQSGKNKREIEEKDNPNWHLNKVTLGYSKRKKSSSLWGRGSSRKMGTSRSRF